MRKFDIVATQSCFFVLTPDLCIKQDHNNWDTSLYCTIKNYRKPVSIWILFCKQVPDIPRSAKLCLSICSSKKQRRNKVYTIQYIHEVLSVKKSFHFSFCLFCLDQLGPAWTSLDQLGPAWTSLDQLGPAWTSLDQLGPAWTS